METRAARWWVPLVRGPAVLLAAIVGPLYRLFFGWVDRRFAKKLEERLAADVKLALSSFFKQGRARIVANEGVPFPPAFDYAFVTVEIENFLLRFSRGLEELGVHIASASASSDWHDLSLVLGAISGEEELQRRAFKDLWEVSRLLEPHVEALTQIFRSERFSEVKEMLESQVYSWERNAIKAAEAELNWRLYHKR